MHGFFNTVLRINLTRQSFEIQVVSDTVLYRGLGGKGLASHLLLHHNPAGVDPFNPENHLVFANGPTAGTGIWGSSRYGLFTKSPQTGFFSESYACGEVADHISATGFDAVVFHGAADEPVWVEVHEDSVLFHPADSIRAKSTCEMATLVRGWIKDNRPGQGKCGVVTIGVAREVFPGVAENNCLSSAGRTEAGAVLKSKKIQAIAFRGNKVKTVADPKKVQAFVWAMSERFGEGRGDRVHKILGSPISVFRNGEDRLTILDTLVLCRFFRDLYQWEELAAILQGVVGFHFTVEQLREIACNVTNDIRRFNLREGMKPGNKHLPKRLCQEVLPESGEIITETQMARLLGEYSKERGLDTRSRVGQDVFREDD